MNFCFEPCFLIPQAASFTEFKATHAIEKKETKQAHFFKGLFWVKMLA